MEVPESAGWWKPAWWTALGSAVALGGLLQAQPVAVQPRLQVTFPGREAGQTDFAAAVPIGSDSLWVTVVVPGADPNQAALRPTAAGSRVELVGHDPVSRLGFLRIRGRESSRRMEWRDRIARASGQTLYAMSPAGMVKCRTHGWVQQVGGKILPLALIRVVFQSGQPPAGSALTDEDGRVAAVFFQPSGNGSTGFAIPAEAVHRVKDDICSKGRLVRGWIGLSLRADQQAPQVVRVLANSPAARSGIRPRDILTEIGSYPISSYADAVNAFFYLRPDQPVKVKVLRGVEPLEVTVTPVTPRRS